MTVPVVFIIFNRPDTTIRVFNEIRRYRPERLLVIADGPRNGRAGESDRCIATRQIIDSVDWPCQVQRCWSDVNLGCRKRVSSGLTWAFSQTDAAIVLEDDCLPEPSFFPYCEELLARYAKDERVASICGGHFLDRRNPTNTSYRFSRFSHIWGWASWSRAWRNYDVDMQAWAGLRQTGWLRGECSSDIEVDFWQTVFDRVAAGRIDTWDYQWIFSCWTQRRVSVVPAVNLISNIGFGANATHTTNISRWANLPTSPIEAELRHPTTLAIDHDADNEVARLQYRRSWKRRLWDRWIVRQ